jgi:alkylhydroperoxidase family enzyme
MFTIPTFGPVKRSKLDLMGIRFADEGGDGTGAGAADAAAAHATADAAAAAVGGGTPSAWDGKIESLDPGVQKIIGDLRKENGDRRVALTASEQRTTAILAAAGITSDADPVEAAKTAATERDTATAKALASARELAIYKAAGAAGADPAKLLDSNTFTASVSGIDPTDGPAVLAAITAALATNPNLKAARAAGASSVDNPGGTGETGQITEAQLAQMTAEQISTAYDKGQLSHLIG